MKLFQTLLKKVDEHNSDVFLNKMPLFINLTIQHYFQNIFVESTIKQ